MTTKKIIGREDKLDFPEINLENIQVKVDTGAFTSAIHCSEIKEVEEDGTTFIEFRILDENSPGIFNVLHKTKNYEKRTIKSSFGNEEERFIVETHVIIFGESVPIELSLTNRGNMKVPILLGRKFINGRFIVNTSVKNASFKKKEAGNS